MRALQGTGRGTAHEEATGDSASVSRAELASLISAGVASALAGVLPQLQAQTAPDYDRLAQELANRMPAPPPAARGRQATPGTAAAVSELGAKFSLTKARAPNASNSPSPQPSSLQTSLAASRCTAARRTRPPKRS